MRQDVRARKIRHTNSCYFTMVAIDDKGRPTPAPEIEIKDAMQQCRFDAGLERKKLRMEGSQRISCDISKLTNKVANEKSAH